MYGDEVIVIASWPSSRYRNGKADRKYADLVQLVLNIELGVDDRLPKAGGVIAVPKLVIAVRLIEKPCLYCSDLLGQLFLCLYRKEHRVSNLDIREPTIRKDQVTIPSGDRLKLRFILQL